MRLRGEDSALTYLWEAGGAARRTTRASHPITPAQLRGATHRVEHRNEVHPGSCVGEFRRLCLAQLYGSTSTYGTIAVSAMQHRWPPLSNKRTGATSRRVLTSEACSSSCCIRDHDSPWTAYPTIMSVCLLYPVQTQSVRWRRRCPAEHVACSAERSCGARKGVSFAAFSVCFVRSPRLGWGPRL